MATALPNAGKTGRYGDLKRRLLFLLGALVVFRVGAHIPVPGIDPDAYALSFETASMPNAASHTSTGGSWPCPITDGNSR